MQRNTNRQSENVSLAELTWKAFDLVCWPLRESTSLARRFFEGSPDEQTDEETSAEPVPHASDPSVATDDQEETSTPETDDDHGDSAPDDQAAAGLEDIWGVGPARAPKLREQGLTTLHEVAQADVSTLTDLPGVGDHTAERIKQSAADLAGV